MLLYMCVMSPSVMKINSKPYKKKNLKYIILLIHLNPKKADVRSEGYF